MKNRTKQTEKMWETGLDLEEIEISAVSRKKNFRGKKL